MATDLSGFGTGVPDKQRVAAKRAARPVARPGTPGAAANAPITPGRFLRDPLAVSLTGAWVVPPAVLVASLSRHMDLWLGVLLLIGLVAAAVLTGFRTFAHVFMFAAVIRPLLDLTAGERDGGGVSATELFGIAILGAMSVWLWLNRDDLVRRLWFSLPLALISLVLCWVLAAAGSMAPVSGAVAALRVATGVAAYLVVDLLLVTHRMTLRQVVGLVVTTSIVPLAYPLLGLAGVTVTHVKDDVTALKSVFYLSNQFAFFLVPLAILGTSWALWTRGRTRLLASAWTIVVLVELMLSQTRGAWAAAALGMFIVATVYDRRYALVAMVGGVLVAVFVPEVNARLLDLIPDPDDPRTQSSLAWRFDQWASLLPDLRTSPVLGGGPDFSVLSTGKEPHNDYLKALIETGVLGLAVYLWVVGSMAYVAWSALTRSLERYDRLTAGGVPARGSHTARGHGPSVMLPATCAAIAGYVTAMALASFGDNLIDNVTYLWSTLPLLAMAQRVRTAGPDEDLDL